VPALSRRNNAERPEISRKADNAC